MASDGPGPMSARPIGMTNKVVCDVCGHGRGHNSKVSHRKCSEIRKARGFAWIHQPKEGKGMSNTEELKEAVETAEGLLAATPSITAAEITYHLNDAYEGTYYWLDDVVYLRNEPDYLKPHLVVRLW